MQNNFYSLLFVGLLVLFGGCSYQTTNQKDAVAGLDSVVSQDTNIFACETDSDCSPIVLDYGDCQNFYVTAVNKNFFDQEQQECNNRCQPKGALECGATPINKTQCNSGVCTVTCEGDSCVFILND